MALVTLPQVKVYLGIPLTDTSQDAQLTMFISDVGAVFQNFLHGRRLEQGNYTEFYQGNGTRFIILRQRPVQAVLNVWLDYNGYYGQGVNPDGSIPFAPETLQEPGTYALVLDSQIDGPGGPATLTVGKSGLLARVNWNWPDIGALYLPGNLAREGGQFLGNLKVEYRAGYPAGFIPADVQYAARLQISIMRQMSAKGRPLQSESDSVTGYSYSLMNQSAGEAPEIGSIRQILSSYREIPGMAGDLSSLPSNNTSGGWR